MHKQTLSHGVTQLTMRHYWMSLCTLWQSYSQQIYIKICLKLEHYQQNLFEYLGKIWWWFSQTKIQFWYQWLKHGLDSIENGPQSGTSTSRMHKNVEWIETTIKGNQQLMLQELEDLVIPQTVQKRFSHFVYLDDLILHEWCRDLGQILHPLQPIFDSLRLLAFLKTEIFVEREEIKGNMRMAILKENFADYFKIQRDTKISVKIIEGNSLKRTKLPFP